MPRRDPRVTAYIQRRAPFARPILRSLRARILAGGSGLEETIKWGMPTFMYRGKIVCGIAGFKAHCALWFGHGKAIVGSSRRGDGMGHFGRIRVVKETPSAARLKGYVKKAMRLIDEGIGRRP
jgi:uncharacterized protein YdhG (YjbR/CyaY superfamily)